MSTPLARWRALDVRVRDGVGAAALLVLVVVDAAVPRDRPPWAVTLVVAAATVTLVWRRSRPVVPLTASTLALGVAALAGSPGSGGVAASLVAVYSAVAWGSRRLGGAVALVCATVIVVPALGGAQGPEVAIAGYALYAIAVVGGLLARARRDTVEAVRERAERAEATRDLEASRRVAQERLRIARELHDVIGHHVAVINVQAAVADRLLDRRPEQAHAALGHVQDASERVLGELGTLVRVLREGPDEAPPAPARGLRDVDELAREARAAGLEVSVTTAGRVVEAPPVVDLAAYRIVQESLTNARKHGTGRADVLVRYDEDAVTLQTTNPTGTPPQRPDRTGPGGFGLVGLRERATAVGGTFEAGPSGSGTFVLRATIPFEVASGRPTRPAETPEGP